MVDLVRLDKAMDSIDAAIAEVNASIDEGFRSLGLEPPVIGEPVQKQKHSSINLNSMTQTQIKIPDVILSVLANCSIADKDLALPPGQLDRKVYEEVNKVLTLMGGKWHKGKKVHVFPECPADLMDTVLLTGEITDTKKLFQQFNTPQELALRMVKFADIHPGDRILEPSAGTGNILRATGYINCVRDGFCDVIAIELDTTLIAALCETARQFGSPSTAVKQGNFLFFNNSPLSESVGGNIGLFRVILMNPPFTRGQDVKHILHARKFLTTGGRLVAICANGPKQQEALKPIASYWEELPAGTFAESGTNVSTAIIVIDN